MALPCADTRWMSMALVDIRTLVQALTRGGRIRPPWRWQRPGASTTTRQNSAANKQGKPPNAQSLRDLGVHPAKQEDSTSRGDVLTGSVFCGD
eukprot:4482800-Pyramimonas_sp.AAC.1